MGIDHYKKLWNESADTLDNALAASTREDEDND